MVVVYVETVKIDVFLKSQISHLKKLQATLRPTIEIWPFEKAPKIVCLRFESLLVRN